MDVTPELALLAAGLALAIGLGLGILIGRRGRRDLARIRELEREIEALRSEEQRYRSSVSKHFGRTSDLFRDLTERYTELYAHLAEGARELTPESPPPLARGFGPGLLPGTEAAPEPHTEAEAAESGGVESRDPGEEERRAT
jgi:hypothetical protein